MQKKRAHKVRIYLTKKWNRIISAIMLSFVLVLNLIAFIGCAGGDVLDTPLFHERPPAYKIIIESPPTRIVYVGSIDHESKAFVNECLVQMRKVPYRNYRFNDSLTVNSNVDFESDESTSRTHTYNRNVKVKR